MGTAAAVPAAPTAAAAAAASDGTAAPPAPSVDRAKPIVSQVGGLGPAYWTWVHEPEPGQPRFFGSALVESISKTPWWLVPLLWLPLFTYCLAAAVAWRRVPPLAAAGLALLGVLGWQLLEYLIHRFIFHAELNSRLGITFHFLFHGCHHKYPLDKLRLVFPPVPAALVVGAVYGSLTATLPYGTALAVFAGMGYGYVAYDCLHYMVHHVPRGALPGPLLRDLKRRHMHHHYRDHSRGYGISSVLFDILLCTQSA
ncbi:Fatty acid 2-hydroxylase 1 [Tetrabaena socialis]|uniref:Fatty acid 2-hydroxylase 1 n=1 Tax=Tetrabaena socialis TaxID=47790 RepID=A0A2J8AEC8_9CHLO|nr:Fatty acid 2-hydroxylase 1 [Tetrabaena socialis]|eukprot:PNH10880.1 Fatty acid 2-hydroxylase 1 [Tetrabaena socialis]